MARTELFRQKGLAYAELEKAGIYLPVVEGHCRYFRPARYDDLLTVAARVAEASPARLSFTYAVRRGETTLAEGSTAHAFINRAGRPLNLKKAAPELWHRIAGFISPPPPAPPARHRRPA
ncbi:MAG: thioesterase family protein [Bacillota bacterium]|nr:thioesterase family protein [Bacillota bacterium]